MAAKRSIWIGRKGCPGKVYTLKADSQRNPQEWMEASLASLREKNPGVEFIGKVVSVPGMRSLEKWTFDSVCKSVGGKKVEPDGYDPNGYPSWLLVMSIL